jgi:hypothetical protein
MEEDPSMCPAVAASSVVPFVTAWSNETEDTTPVVMNPRGGIAYLALRAAPGAIQERTDAAHGQR